MVPIHRPVPLRHLRPLNHNHSSITPATQIRTKIVIKMDEDVRILTQRYSRD